jgi:hypothetical protein
MPHRPHISYSSIATRRPVTQAAFGAGTDRAVHAATDVDVVATAMKLPSLKPEDSRSETLAATGTDDMGEPAPLAPYLATGNANAPSAELARVQMANEVHTSRFEPLIFGSVGPPLPIGQSPFRPTAEGILACQ